MSRSTVRIAAVGFVLCAAIVFVLDSGLCGCEPRYPSPGPKVEPAPPVVSRTLENPMQCPHELAGTRRGGSDPDRYLVPSRDAAAALRGAIAALVTPGGTREAAARAASSAGYEIVEIKRDPSLVLVRERDDARHGGGAYLVRLGSRSDLVIQAPHTFFDQGTLELGCALFHQSSARAFFINTAHRYRAAAQRPDGTYPADVAHASDSMFHAATLGALEDPRIRFIVQLHGFGQRESAAAAVVSTGENLRGGVFLGRVARALEASLAARVERFPDDTSELGATTNVQGEAVRAAGRLFLHIEMSGETRTRLLKDDSLAATVFQSLVLAIGPG
jgi:hypothetical protein